MGLFSLFQGVAIIYFYVSTYYNFWYIAAFQFLKIRILSLSLLSIYQVSFNSFVLLLSFIYPCIYV